MHLDIGHILQTVIEVVITIALPYYLGKGIVLLNAKLADLKKRSSDADLATARSLVYDLVRAAEQLGITGMLENIGIEKKKFVIDQLEKALAKRGITIDLDEIDMLIEGTVHDAFKDVQLP